MNLINLQLIHRFLFVSKPASYGAFILYFIQTLLSCTCPNKHIQYSCYTYTIVYSLFDKYTDTPVNYLVYLLYFNNND